MGAILAMGGVLVQYYISSVHQHNTISGSLWHTTFHQSISITPFQALYGIPPPTVINYLSWASVVEEVEKESQEREELMRQLKENLNKAGNRMKYQADNKRQD
jgi:hypothetical protein